MEDEKMVVLIEGWAIKGGVNVTPATPRPKWKLVGQGIKPQKIILVVKEEE